jgi:hypothetical protein
MDEKISQIQLFKVPKIDSKRKATSSPWLKKFLKFSSSKFSKLTLKGK